MNYKIAQLMLSANNRNTACDIYISQTDSHKENLGGKLFALVEIESREDNDYKVIDFLINSLGKNYYQNEKIILRERVESLKVEHIFESALIKTNKALIEFLKNERISIDPGLINATIGVIYKDELHFSSLGKNRAMLILRNKKDNQYRLVDITAKTENPEEDHHINIAKLFPNVVSGSIPSDSYFIVSNEALPEYLSGKQLTEIVTTLPQLAPWNKLKTPCPASIPMCPFWALSSKTT
jgi:hypothetical protein